MLMNLLQTYRPLVVFTGCLVLAEQQQQLKPEYFTPVYTRIEFAVMYDNESSHQRGWRQQTPDKVNFKIRPSPQRLDPLLNFQPISCRLVVGRSPSSRLFFTSKKKLVTSRTAYLLFSSLWSIQRS